MKESSSYKHLTVILAALVTAITIAIVVLVILLATAPADSPNAPADTTVNSVLPPSSSSDRPVTSTSPTTTLPNDSPVSDGNTTTTEKPSTDLPPVTDAPIGGGTQTPPDGPIEGSAYGDHLDSLELYAEWTTVSYDAATGSCTLRLDFYCESYSLSIGARFNNYLDINGERIEFRSEGVSVPTDEHKVRSLLYSTEYEVKKASPDEALPVRIEFGWHYQGSYSGEHAEWLTLKTDFVV